MFRTIDQTSSRQRLAFMERRALAWREFKSQLTGKRWDYDFRRLFFSWTPDLTREPFRPWIEVASREKTAGHAQNCDLWVSDDGLVHLLWRERAIDERLRARFFPNERQAWTLSYATLREDKVVSRHTLAQWEEGGNEAKPTWGRFHVTADGRLFVIASFVAPAENRLIELRHDGSVGPAAKLALKHPFTAPFFTATPRAGTPPSNTIELLGECESQPQHIRYSRIMIGRPTTPQADLLPSAFPETRRG